VVPSHRNVQRFRGGLVFKAHRLLYHSLFQVVEAHRDLKAGEEYLATITLRLPATDQRIAVPVVRGLTPFHPGGNPGANLKLISHR